VIDGYNVIRRDPDLRGREAEGLPAGRAALLALVAGLARGVPDDFTVVFDGARRTALPPPGGRVRVVFSRPPESADDVVRALAGRLRDGAIVVTSDRAVQDSARRAGATAVSAEAFLAAAAGDESEGREDDEEEDDQPGPRRGNPRRASRADRAAARALGRLRRR
jgi:hypothetical protein